MKHNQNINNPDHAPDARREEISRFAEIVTADLHASDIPDGGNNVYCLLSVVAEEYGDLCQTLCNGGECPDAMAVNHGHTSHGP